MKVKHMQRLTHFAVLLLSLLIGSDGSVRADERDDFFEAKIRPVLVGTCFRCHGGAKTSGGEGRCVGLRSPRE